MEEKQELLKIDISFVGLPQLLKFRCSSGVQEE
jgi:hypothetical protein